MKEQLRSPIWLASRALCVLCAALLLCLAASFAALFQPSRAYAATEPVYVVTKITTDYGTGNPYSLKYTYTKKGLIKTVSNGGEISATYQYNKKGQLTSIKDASGNYGNTFSYNSKGRISKVTVKGRHDSDTYTAKYSYNSKGRLSKKVVTHPVSQNTSTYRYTYYSNGKPKTDGFRTFNYDKRKNLTSMSNIKYGGVVQYKNTYKNGRLVKRQVIPDGSTTPTLTCTYTYKKMEVSTKYASKARQQRWALINNDLCGVFGSEG